MTVVKDFTALTGDGYHWGGVQGQKTAATSTIIAYSFPRTMPDSYLKQYGAETAKTFRAFSEQDKAVALKALDAWASVSGLTFVEVPDQSGELRFLWIDGRTAPDPIVGTDWGGQGFSPYSSFYFDNNVQSVVPVNQSYWISQGYNYGIGGATAYSTLYSNQSENQFLATLLHEIGHTIGFKHPHQGEPLLDTAIDAASNTVMSYQRNTVGDVLGPLDIQAVQYLYGGPSADGTHLQSWQYNANTVTFNMNGKISADVIRGTSVRDVIDGAAGNDAIAGWFGNDRIIGGLGNDQMVGGEGLDTAVFRSSRNAAVIYKGSDLWTSVTTSEGADWVSEFERFEFNDVTVAFDVTGNAGQAYRLYQAAFARTPDKGGLSFWVDRIDDGATLRQAAAGFVDSAEFSAAYGTKASADQYVAKFYQNVLGRSGEAGGVAFWVGELNRGAPLADVLLGFSQSSENVSRLAPIIGQSIDLDPAYFV